MSDESKRTIESYGKVWPLWHRSIRQMFARPVNVEEKIDGSQFSFALLDGELHLRSHRATVYRDTTDALFAPAVRHVVSLLERGALNPGWIYRCETLFRRKHNTLEYARVPAGNLVLFDVQDTDSTFLSPSQRAVCAKWLEIDCVPTLAERVEVTNAQHLQSYLDRESFLGGCKIEGVVCKPAEYDVWCFDGHVAMCKLVSERFKEAHRGCWKAANPTRADVIERIIAALKTEARWSKAVQHLREDGKLTDTPTDIGALMVEVQNDVREECSDEIRDALYAHAIKTICRGVSAGLPEWYKQRLADAQFADEGEAA